MKKAVSLITSLTFLYLIIPFFCVAQSSDSLSRIDAGFSRSAILNTHNDYQPRASSFIVPAAFITYGVISLTGNNFIRQLDKSTRNELQEDHPLFAAHADDYMQFAPAAAVYGLNLLGIKGKNSLIDATGIYLISEVIMGISVSSLKSLTQRERPDQSAFNSFPSGHTANAFAAAEFLNQEYKDVSPWYGYAGYTIAAATGILRLYNNKHWVSDVVAGAGFGIVSTRLSYLLYPKLKRLILGSGKENYNLVPSYQQHSFGFSFQARF